MENNVLHVGEEAPHFCLPDQDGKMHSLQDYRGSWVLLYFYPKDDTPGCTIEACSIRDNFSEFKKAGIVVLGMSADSVGSHKKFEKKFNLPFTLLSDEGTEVIQAYKAWGGKKLFGHEFDGVFRISYIINPEGLIAAVYPKVKPDEHVLEVLNDLINLS